MLGKEVGPYRVLQKIAQGGMSSVYKGLHIDLEQDVAIKVLSSESFEDPCLRDRFINEAKIQAKLSHPNVIKTLNYLEQDGSIFLVMEYVNGETLDVLLKKIGPLPLEKAVVIFMGVLDAIEFMHSKGIIHRDIKPANIMLAYDRFVKVMDFGIAKIMGEKGKTRAGIRIGTLWYMSPEQIRGEEATALTDIYSLGITLYQMITGRVPFTGELEFDIMRGHLEETPDPPWKINRDVPKELGEVILKALAKKPAERYQSIREFSEALRSIMKIHEINQTRAIQVPDNFIDRLKCGRLSPGLCTAKHGIMIAAVVIAIAAIGAFAVLAQGKGKSTDPAAVMPNVPIQAINPALGSPETDFLVEPMPMQSAAEKQHKKQQKLTKAPSHGNVGRTIKTEKKETAAAELHSRIDSTKANNRPYEAGKEAAPDSAEDNGWRIRK